MFSTVYHKKAFVLKIPLRPPLPKGDNKDDSHIFMRFLPNHFHDDPKKYGERLSNSLKNKDKIKKKTFVLNGRGDL
jgi:hypothetical protein